MRAEARRRHERAPRPSSPLEELAPYLLSARPAGPFRWPAVFGNDRPVEIEVGFGKGLFLLNASEACPTSTSWASRSSASTSSSPPRGWPSAARSNVRLVCADAWHFSATASPRLRSRPSTFISPTRGGRNGITSAACLPRNSGPSAGGPCGRAAGFTSPPTWKSTSTCGSAGGAAACGRCRRRDRRSRPRPRLSDELRAQVPQGGPADPPGVLRAGEGSSPQGVAESAGLGAGACGLTVT